MPNEPLPIKEFLDELDSQWNVPSDSATPPEPRIIEVTGETSDPLRFDLNVKDVVVGRAGNPAISEQPIGNWTYGDRSYNIDLDNNSRLLPFTVFCIESFPVVVFFITLSLDV